MHYEVLTHEGKRLFPYLKQFPDFYLAGGTALALQIGHRVSIDFDLFSDRTIKKTLLPKVEDVFAGMRIRIVVNNANELTLLVDGVKITFLFYPFPILLPKTREDGIDLLSVKEIAATKAYTLGRRGELKDYIDMYFILNGKRSILSEVAELAERKYGEVFDRRLFFEQLLYLGDIEDVEISFLNDRVGKNELRSFFEEEIRKVKV